MRKSLICAFAAAALLCSCGDSDTSSKAGSLTRASATTTTTVQAPETSEPETTTTATAPETSQAPGYSLKNVTPEVPAKRSIKIMTFGDSITDGYWMPGGYRKYLCDMLEDTGYAVNVDFVGRKQDGDCYDPDNEGYSGYLINCPEEPSIGELVPQELRIYKPDVLTIMIGTNDILGEFKLETAADRLEALLDSAFPLMPEDGMIYVSPIPPVDVAIYGASAEVAKIYDGYIDTFNEQVRALVAKKKAEGRRIELIEAGTALGKSDMIDGVHPNAEGYKKLAEVWYEVIKKYITE